MDINAFQNSSAGHSACIMGDDWAFAPDPLPPALYGSVELIAALSEADQVLAAIEGPLGQAGQGGSG